MRLLWQGAENRGRGRQTTWRGDVSIRGAKARQMAPVNLWNPERLLSLENGDRLRFDAITTGNFAGADLWFDNADAELTISSNHVSGNVALSDLGLEDRRFDAGALDRAIVVRRLPDQLRVRQMSRRCRISLNPTRDNPVWLRVRTEDGHVAWSSPIYLTRDARR